MNSYLVLIYYKFIRINDPAKYVKEHAQICRELSLKGRVLISPQGINGTIEGSVENINRYEKWMNAHPLFHSITYKRSTGNGEAFEKMSVKARKEIVTLGTDDVYEYGPLGVTGAYIDADTLHSWIVSGEKEFYIVDLRNDYEFEVGRFRNSIIPEGMRNFRDLPHVLHSIEHLKHKTIVTVCTGGIRCEIASGFLIKHGFTDVHQLHDGIVTYMEKYPNDGFDGKLYVFDNRVLIGFNCDAPDHTVVGTCRICGDTSENMVDYYRAYDDGTFSGRQYGIVCENCIQAKKVYTDTEYETLIYPQKKAQQVS